MTDLATVEAVELASVGSHDCMTGTWDCTPQDIADAVEAAKEPDWRAPVIKLGHTDPRFDGQPAVGTIRNLRASEDGTRLIGDLTDMPRWLADVMHSAYPSRSVEGLKKDIAASGKAYSFRLTALALLGVEPPAIESLADVARMYAVAAANSQQASGYGQPVVTTPTDAPIAAAAAPTHPKGAGMTPEQIREAVGLRPEASEIELAAKLAALGLIPTSTEPVVEPPKVETPKAVETPVEPKVETPKTEVPDISEHPVFKALKESHDQLVSDFAAQRETQAASERDQFLTDAVSAGRLKPAEREKFASLFDAAPDVTREIILARARGSEVPISETPRAHSANPEGAIDEFETAIPDPGKGF